MVVLESRSQAGMEGYGGRTYLVRFNALERRAILLGGHVVGEEREVWRGLGK